jgi:predicted negative regulator of RcsB-dependent stress response
MKIKHCITFLIAVVFMGGLSTFTLRAAEESQAELKAQAKITQAEAEKTALAKVPGGKIKAAELEKEHGKLIWSFDISMPKSKNITEIQVDAKAGKIVSTQVETPKDQAAEAAADKKAKK